MMQRFVVGEKYSLQVIGGGKLKGYKGIDAPVVTTSSLFPIQYSKVCHDAVAESGAVLQNQKQLSYARHET